MILGIDPGKDKIGWALVNKNGYLVCSGILAPSNLVSFMHIFTLPSSAWEKHLEPRSIERVSRPDIGASIDSIALGNGTFSKNIARELPVQNFAIIDEAGTTLAARALYWRLHPPRFWQYFLPKSLRIPPRPLDDLAAWAIALKCLKLPLNED